MRISREPFRGGGKMRRPRLVWRVGRRTGAEAASSTLFSCGLSVVGRMTLTTATGADAGLLAEVGSGASFSSEGCDVPWIATGACTCGAEAALRKSAAVAFCDAVSPADSSGRLRSWLGLLCTLTKRPRWRLADLDSRMRATTGLTVRRRDGWSRTKWATGRSECLDTCLETECATGSAAARVRARCLGA